MYRAPNGRVPWRILKNLMWGASVRKGKAEDEDRDSHHRCIIIPHHKFLTTIGFKNPVQATE